MAKIISAALVFSAVAVFLVNGHNHFTGSGGNVKGQSRSFKEVRDNSQGALHVSNGVSEKQLGKSFEEGVGEVQGSKVESQKQLGKSFEEGVGEGQGSKVESQKQKGKESLGEKSQGSYVQESSSGQEMSSGGNQWSMNQEGQGQWEEHKQQQHHGQGQWEEHKQQQQHGGEFGHGSMHNTHRGGW